MFIHNKLYKYIYWNFGSGTKTNGFRADKKAQPPSGFDEFVQFQEVFESIVQIKYLTCHSCAITFSLFIFPSRKRLFPLTVLHCDSCFPYKVYFLYIKDKSFAFPKSRNLHFLEMYVQNKIINLSLTKSLVRDPHVQLLSFFEKKAIH